jgi:hypothetical protein
MDGKTIIKRYDWQRKETLYMGSEIKPTAWVQNRDNAHRFSTLQTAVNHARCVEYFSFKTFEYIILNESRDATEPLPGDAVVTNCRLVSSPQRRPDTEVIGIIEGSHIDGLGRLVTFNASAFRDDKYTSCSGGPAPYILPENLELVGTYRAQFWRWSNGHPGGGNGITYTAIVPLWRWIRPGLNGRKSCVGCYYYETCTDLAREGDRS